VVRALSFDTWVVLRNGGERRCRNAWSYRRVFSIGRVCPTD